MATVAASMGPLGARGYLTALANETAKGLRHAWAERVQIIIELPLFAAFILLLSFLLGRGERVAATGRLEWSLDPRQTTWLFLGFVAFTFFYLQAVKLFWRLLAEIQSGTLEQVYLSPLPSWVIAAAGRTFAAVVETVVVVGVLFVGVTLLVDLQITWRADAVVPLLFLVAASVGYSLVIGGLTLIWKRIEMLQEGLLTIALVVSGAVVPLDRMPDWAAALGRLTPIADPIAGLRATLLDDRGIGLWGHGGLIRLAVTAVVWLLVGAASFRFAERVAKRQGSLSRY
jgi:ABC-2 type transport system permease protein